MNIGQTKDATVLESTKRPKRVEVNTPAPKEVTAPAAQQYATA